MTEQVMTEYGDPGHVAALLARAAEGVLVGEPDLSSLHARHRRRRRQRLTGGTAGAALVLASAVVVVASGSRSAAPARILPIAVPTATTAAVLPLDTLPQAPPAIRRR